MLANSQTLETEVNNHFTGYMEHACICLYNSVAEITKIKAP